MSKREIPWVDLGDYRARKKDQDILEIREGEKRFRVLLQQRWPDEAYDALRAGDLVRGARLVLQGEYADWVAAGGTAAELMDVITEHTGVDLGGASASSP